MCICMKIGIHRIGFFCGGGRHWFELKALCLLSKCYTTWVIPPTLFVLVIFQIGSLFSLPPGLLSDNYPPMSPA
jgi:hypothetical protein